MVTRSHSSVTQPLPSTPLQPPKTLGLINSASIKGKKAAAEGRAGEERLSLPPPGALLLALPERAVLPACGRGELRGLGVNFFVVGVVFFFFFLSGWRTGDPPALWCQTRPDLIY